MIVYLWSIAVIDLIAKVNKVNNTKPKLIFGLFAFLQVKSVKINEELKNSTCQYRLTN